MKKILVLLICLFNITLQFFLLYLQNPYDDGAWESGVTLISQNKCNHNFF